MADLPYTEIAVPVDAPPTEFALAPGAGESFADPRFEEPEDGAGRIAIFVVAGEETTPTTLVVEQGDWSVACPLTSGQFHRLTNALAGRGTRSGIRPESTRGEHVHLTGSPELLIVEDGEHVVHVPAGPKRALWKALRAIEVQVAG